MAGGHKEMVEMRVMEQYSEDETEPDGGAPRPKRIYRPGRLGLLLRERRDLRRISQQELADETGIARDTIKGLERGIIKTINPDYAHKIGAALNIGIDELVVAMGYNLPTADEVRRTQEKLREELGVLNVMRKLLDRRKHGRPQHPEHQPFLDDD